MTEPRIAGAAMACSSRGERLSMHEAFVCRVLGAVGVVFFLAAAFTPLAHVLDVWAGAPAQLEPSDAIVVLGSGVSPDGFLTNASVLRTGRGIALYRKGLAPLLLFLGTANRGGPTEAQVRADIARQGGVPPAAILTDAGGHTTREEAARVKALLQPKGVRTILLVADSLDMRRARPVFERAGFEVRSAPADTFVDPGTPEERLDLLRGVLKESVAWLYYRVAGYL